MPSRKPAFEPLPWAETSEGATRQIGLELELTGLTPEQVASAVVEVIGGAAERESAFMTRVTGTAFGDFSVELDASILRDRRYQEQLSELGVDIGEGATRDNLEELLSRIAGLLVPLELVGPPMPWTELHQLDEIRLRLHEAGARGTHSSPFYAFGLQLNIEAASLDADHLLAMLRAFLLKYDWLLERSEIDLARRISPYVQAYPEDYVVHVLDRHYQPDIDTLIDDFLHFTPTRNRPLDLLPLFAHIDEERVMAAPVEKELIKPRPAFHYRLPNCLVDEPEWNLAVPWNDWVAIERLAHDQSELEKARAQRMQDASRLRRWLSSAIRWLRR